MLCLAALAVAEARSRADSAMVGSNARSADRALLDRLAELEPDPVASALLARRPELAVLVLMERGEFDLELAEGLLRLGR